MVGEKEEGEKMNMDLFNKFCLLTMAIICGSAVAVSSINKNFFEMIALIFGILFFVFLFLTYDETWKVKK